MEKIKCRTCKKVLGTNHRDLEDGIIQIGQGSKKPLLTFCGDNCLKEYEKNEEKKKDRRIKCIYRKQPIHIDNFAGITKKGMLCGKMECLMKLAKEMEDKENKDD